MDSQKRKLNTQQSGIWFQLEQVEQRGKKMIEVQLVKMPEHEKLADLKIRLEEQLKKFNDLHDSKNQKSAHIPIEVDFLLDQNKKILDYPYNDLVSIVKLTQNNKIYYRIKLEENVDDETFEGKNIIGEVQNTYFMSQKMENRHQSPPNLNKEPFISSQQFFPQSMDEDSLPSMQLSQRSISSIIIIKCPTKKCEKSYESRELKEIIYEAILHKRLACCQKCKKQFPSSMYQLLGQVAQYYNDFKISLQLSELQIKIQQSRAKDYLFCKSCNFFCLKQQQYEKSLSKMFCPNCLTFGLQYQ